ncbi:MAG: hypothetical protein ACE5OZ_23045 [Candidatus Heimdallarchaeota archaeon]
MISRDGIVRISEAVASIEVKLSDLQSTFQEKIKGLTTAFKEIQTGLERVELEFEKGSKALSDLSTEQKKHGEAMERLQEQVDSLTAEKNGLEQQLEKNSLSETEVVSLKATVSSLQENNDSVSKALSHEKELNAVLKQLNSEMDQNIQTLEQEHSHFAALVNDLWKGGIHLKIMRFLRDAPHSRADLVALTEADAATVVGALKELEGKGIIFYNEENGMATLSEKR